MAASAEFAELDKEPTARRRVFEILEHTRRRELASRILDVVLVLLILANVAVVIAESVPGLGSTALGFMQAFDRVCAAVFAIEYGLRLWAAPEHPLLASRGAMGARLAFAKTPLMVIDALSVVPIFIELLFPANSLLRLTRLVRFLKLARYSPGLATLGRVVANERRALLACVILFAVLIIGSAAAMHALEGQAQPNRLGDMPSAMWWTTAMLTRIGGSDITPVTVPGRIVATFIMLLGIGFFALPVAIIGRGFYDEIRRRDFVVTFGMVAHIPLFARLDAASIAELVAILKSRTVPSGSTIIRKGDTGDAMYLIASGAVEVATASGPVRLSEGDFFGEMALLSRDRRNATVTACRACDLLVLDAADFARLVERVPEIGERVRAVADARR